MQHDSENMNAPHTLRELGVQPATVTYTNWRGETAVRRIVPLRVWFGSTAWHPEPQWILTALDVDKDKERHFALKDFGQPLTTQDAARVPEIAAERDAYKLRGDNHWETMRCIYRIATVEGDIEAIIQHIKDAGQGYTERPEDTLRHYQTEVARLTSELAALRAIAEGRRNG